MTNKKIKKDLNYYMSLNYVFTVELFEDHDEKTKFGLLIPDLDGVWGHGETIEKAYKDLTEAKEAWLESCLNDGAKIPEPINENDYSGNFILRLDPALHMQLSQGAKHKKKSLNKYIVQQLEENIKNSDILHEIRKQTDEIKRFGHRIDSLEETYSSWAIVTIDQEQKRLDVNSSEQITNWQAWTKNGTPLRSIDI